MLHLWASAGSSYPTITLVTDRGDLLRAGSGQLALETVRRAGVARFPLARSLGIWLVLVATESMHGIVRRLVLEPQLGDLRARQTSVFTGAILIIVVYWLTLHWLGRQPVWRWWQLGLLWLLLTLLFEVGLGRATGMSWDRIASDFDPRRGGFLGFGMLVIALGPRILAARLGLIQDRRQL